MIDKHLVENAPPGTGAVNYPAAPIVAAPEPINLAALKISAATYIMFPRFE